MMTFLAIHVESIRLFFFLFFFLLSLIVIYSSKTYKKIIYTIIMCINYDIVYSIANAVTLLIY